MSQKAKILKIAVPVIIIIVGIFIMKTLISSRPVPEKEVKKDPGILVDILKAERENFPVVINGTGTVETSSEISIVPQVSGRITYASPNLKVGGFFKKDEVLFEMEDTDYRLAVQSAVSAMAKAEYDFASMESQAKIARSEWEFLNKEGNEEPNSLVLYGPQLKSAKAALAATSAQVEQSKINLERTIIRAPFNSRVRSENIDIGQYVKSGSSVAVLAGTDIAEIAVPLSFNEIHWLNVPRYGQRQNGADALVSLDIGKKSAEWRGHVVRSTGEVDPKSRMVQLIVEVNDPYGLRNQNSSGDALATGTFVEISIKGKTLKDVYKFPRKAYRDDSTVWIMDNEGKLRIKKVTPVRIERDVVIVKDGLDEGDQVILTNISGAANGMKLRSIEDHNK